MGARLIDNFIRNILSVPFCPCHFVNTILSNAILSVYHFVHTILSVPFCPYHFVRYHFVLEPLTHMQYTRRMGQHILRFYSDTSTCLSTANSCRNKWITNLNVENLFTGTISSSELTTERREFEEQEKEFKDFCEQLLFRKF